MPPNDLSALLLLAVAGSIALLGALWLYCDRRDRLYFDQTRRKTTFSCLKCSHVYTGVGSDPAPCPRCGHTNPRLRF